MLGLHNHSFVENSTIEIKAADGQLSKSSVSVSSRS